MVIRRRPLAVLALVALVVAGGVVGVALSRQSGDGAGAIPPGQALFAVPVKSFVTLPTDTFNQRLQEAQLAGEAWTEDPLLIALEYLSDLAAGVVGIVKEDDRAESPTRSTVTVIRDELLDDAVRAIWNQFHLERDQAGNWHLVELREAYRCRRGGQQEFFGAELCP